MGVSTSSLKNDNSKLLQVIFVKLNNMIKNDSEIDFKSELGAFPKQFSQPAASPPTHVPPKHYEVYIALRFLTDDHGGPALAKLTKRFMHAVVIIFFKPTTFMVFDYVEDGLNGKEYSVDNFPACALHLGHIENELSDIEKWIRERKSYKQEDYDVLWRNCQTFVNDFCKYFCNIENAVEAYVFTRWQ